MLEGGKVHGRSGEEALKVDVYSLIYQSGLINSVSQGNYPMSRLKFKVLHVGIKFNFVRRESGLDLNSFDGNMEVLVYFINNWVLLKICVHFAEVFLQLDQKLYYCISFYTHVCTLFTIVFACNTESMVSMAYHICGLVSEFHYPPEKGTVSGEFFSFIRHHK